VPPYSSTSTTRPPHTLYSHWDCKIEHNYRWNSFFYFLVDPPTISGSAIVLLYDPPTVSFFFVIEILKAKYDFHWGLFFYFLEVPPTALTDYFTTCPSSFLLIVIRILFGDLLIVCRCPINRHHFAPL
jgi:hypothetical protein